MLKQGTTFALAVDGDLFKAILTFPRLRDEKTEA